MGPTRQNIRSLLGLAVVVGLPVVSYAQAPPCLTDVSSCVMPGDTLYVTVGVSGRSQVQLSSRNGNMRFAKYTFIGAGIWGLAVLLPFYALVDVTGRQYALPADYPQFFWGFFAVAIAWQVAFVIIGSDPARFRPLMIPAIIEKLGFVATLVALFAAGRLSFLDLQPALPDFVLSVLFLVAFALTRRRIA
jgi:hypothetical protein